MNIMDIPWVALLAFFWSLCSEVQWVWCSYCCVLAFEPECICVIHRGANIFHPLFIGLYAFSALTLLVGCQEGHPVRKNLTDEVLAWLVAGVKCK